MSEHEITHTLIIIFFFGIMIQWLSWKIKFPSIILLLLAGVIVGPVLGLISPAAQFGSSIHILLKISLAVILFEGGLQLKLHELKDAGKIVRRIITWGAALNFFFLTLASRWLLDLSWPISFCLSSILIVTGPTVILPMLKQSRIPKKLSSCLKWEGIIIDPIGAILTVLFFDFVTQVDANEGIKSFFVGLFLSILPALFLAYLATLLIDQLFRKSQVSEHLKVPFVFSLVLLIYLISDLVQPESGIMATTIFGIILGNRRLPILEELQKFKETITVMIIPIIFILLSASLDPNQLKLILEPKVILFVVAVIFIIRPAAITLSLIGTDINAKEQAFLSWIAPRGIVAAAVTDVFAPKLVATGHPEADILVPIVFTVIFATVFLHGSTVNFLASKLSPDRQTSQGLLVVGATAWSKELSRLLKEMELPVVLADPSWNHLQSAKMEGIKTFFGEVLSEFSEESLDLTHTSRVLAATDNDAYNALVCNHFTHKMGRENVFQLAPYHFEEEEKKNYKLNLRGNVIIGEDDVFTQLERKHYQGWSFQKTKLTDSFSFEDLTTSLPEKARLIAVVKEQKVIDFFRPDRPFSPKKGDIVISYVPEEKSS